MVAVWRGLSVSGMVQVRCYLSRGPVESASEGAKGEGEERTSGRMVGGDRGFKLWPELPAKTWLRVGLKPLLARFGGRYFLIGRPCPAEWWQGELHLDSVDLSISRSVGCWTLAPASRCPRPAISRAGGRFSCASLIFGCTRLVLRPPVAHGFRAVTEFQASCPKGLAVAGR